VSRRRRKTAQYPDDVSARRLRLIHQVILLPYLLWRWSASKEHIHAVQPSCHGFQLFSQHVAVGLAGWYSGCCDHQREHTQAFDRPDPSRLPFSRMSRLLSDRQLSELIRFSRRFVIAAHPAPSTQPFKAMTNVFSRNAPRPRAVCCSPASRRSAAQLRQQTCPGGQALRCGIGPTGLARWFPWKVVRRRACSSRPAFPVTSCSGSMATSNSITRSSPASSTQQQTLGRHISWFAGGADLRVVPHTTTLNRYDQVIARRGDHSVAISRQVGRGRGRHGRRITCCCPSQAGRLSADDIHHSFLEPGPAPPPYVAAQVVRWGVFAPFYHPGLKRRRQQPPCSSRFSRSDQRSPVCRESW